MKFRSDVRFMASWVDTEPRSVVGSAHGRLPRLLGLGKCLLSFANHTEEIVLFRKQPAEGGALSRRVLP